MNLASTGELQLDVLRNRLSSLEPKLVAKHQRRMPCFDDHVISMYARGMTVREIRAPLLELYGAAVKPSLIFTMTDEVIEEVRQWQHCRCRRLRRSMRRPDPNLHCASGPQFNDAGVMEDGKAAVAVLKPINQATKSMLNK